MKLSRRGFLAAAAPVIAGGTALALPFAARAQNAAAVAAKPAIEPKLTQPEAKPYLFEQVVSYSKENPVVVIGIAKGKKETLLTGEQIGEKLSGALMKIHDAPSKYFVEPGGDYTAIIFGVKGLLYGPYGLKESLSGMALAAASYDDVIRPTLGAAASSSRMASKPEPK